MKKKFAKLKYKIKKEFEWQIQHFDLKYRIPLHKKIKFVFDILKFGILLLSFVTILVFSEIVLFGENYLPYFNENFSTEYIGKSSLLGIQITLTLICVSLIALISNIDKKYIYGEKLLNLAFPSILFPFKVALIILFGLLITNVFLMLNGSSIVYVLLLFLITMYVAIFVLFRFAIVFLNQKSFKKDLACKYYYSNLNYMRRAKPLESHTSESLSQLKSVTLKHLANNDMPELNENMILYFDLLKVTLFNNSKVVQEYYTEHIFNREDIIGHISEIASTMLYRGRALYALQTYNALLKNINYFKVICINDVAFSSNYFIEAFVDVSDKVQMKLYLNQLLIMSERIIQQTYLYSVSDLSYCRLGKDNIYYFAQRDMYEKIYDLIQQSKILNDKEKEELKETLRMQLINTVVTMGLYADVDTFKNKKIFADRTQYRLDIKGEPIAKYFIRLIENYDYNTLINYKYLCSVTEEKTDKSPAFALILSILCVLNEMCNEKKSKYLYDIIIDKEKTQDLFKKYRILDVNIDNNSLKSFYEFISTHYVADDDQKYDSKNNIYSFHPKFAFDKKVIDTLFAYVYSKKIKGSNVNKIAKDKELSVDKKVQEQICLLDS